MRKERGYVGVLDSFLPLTALEAQTWAPGAGGGLTKAGLVGAAGGRPGGGGPGHTLARPRGGQTGDGGAHFSLGRRRFERKHDWRG